MPDFLEIQYLSMYTHQIKHVQTVSTCTSEYQQNTINHTPPLPINTSMSLGGSTCPNSQSLPNHQEGRDVVVFFQTESFMEECTSSYFLMHILLANNFIIVYQSKSHPSLTHEIPVELSGNFQLSAYTTVLRTCLEKSIHVRMILKNIK